MCISCDTSPILFFIVISRCFVIMVPIFCFQIIKQIPTLVKKKTTSFIWVGNVCDSETYRDIDAFLVDIIFRIWYVQYDHNRSVFHEIFLYNITDVNTFSTRFQHSFSRHANPGICWGKTLQIFRLKSWIAE
jgi:hypothetical protein